MRAPSRYFGLSLVTILLAAVASCDAPDKKWVSDTSGVSFVIPGDYGWKVQPPGRQVKISLVRKGPFSGGSVSYSEMPQKGPVTIGQKAGEAWETRYFKRSLNTKVAGSMTTFHGRPAYEFESQEKDPESGVQARTKAILCSTGNTVFSIMATTARKGTPRDPFEEPVIKKFMDSIQIPDSPQPATASR